ncbi:hypothetical protein [Streptomyces sp. NPDC052179]|uniref:hypothetical protein n=1 Tax=Streptomyces sp. NPDC052179 TaxID=3155680 RepID=UPI0034200271
MATKSFAINRTPHVAEIGEELELRFQPEVMGDEFMDAYQQLRTAQQQSGVDLDDLTGVDGTDLRRVTRAVRVFLGGLMLPDSAELMLRLDVEVDGAVVESFQDLDAALARAGELEGGRVVDGLRLPERVLMELVNWVIELYSGGQRPPTSSTGSSTASRPPGTRGTGNSRSRESTRMNGR